MMQLLTEVCDNGSVFDLYSKKNAIFKLATAWRMARECANGFAHIHEMGYMHRSMRAQSRSVQREPFPFPQPLLPPPPANPPIPSISLSDSVLVRFSFVFSTSLSQSYAGMFVFFVCCFDALFFSHDVTLHSLTPLSLNIHDLSPSSTMEVRESGGRRVSGCGDNPSPALNRKNISQIECSLSRANPLRPCTVDLNATRGEDGDLHTGTLTGAPRYAPRASCRCTWLRRPTRLRACFGRPKACLPKRAPSGLGALVVENDEGGCGRSAP